MQTKRDVRTVCHGEDQEGHCWVDPRYRDPLEDAGLAAFNDIMATSQGRCLRVLPDRENWYLPLNKGMYLKKHRVRTWSTRVRAKVGSEPTTSAGRTEAENVRALVARGIDVMPLVAFGEKLHASGHLESFLLTEELEGYRELQDFMKRRFASQSVANPSIEGNPDRSSRAELRQLIRQVAEIARRFHGAGFNHRDFYCCHFLIKELSPGRFDIRLIDLQRVERRRWFRRRWIVKDLAQLASMAPGECVRCGDKLAFMRHYLGVRKLRPADKRLLRAVVRKQALIERRERRKA